MGGEEFGIVGILNGGKNIKKQKKHLSMLSLFNF
jgi:hypothetical protein